MDQLVVGQELCFYLPTSFPKRSLLYFLNKPKNVHSNKYHPLNNSTETYMQIGDFGILVRSGFTVTKALFFNFLSALVALAGTALVLVWGNEPGQSSLIEVVNNIFALLALDLV
jgi:hypothetical protein